MKLKAGFPIAAVILLVGGCGGGGEAVEGQLPITPPPPPTIGDGDTSQPPVLGAACEAGADRGGARGGLWAGSVQANDPGEMRLLVAETGEFQWIAPSGWQQIFGTFRTGDRSLTSNDAIWVWMDGLTWLETKLVGVSMTGELDDDSNLLLSYETDSTPQSDGTLSFAACNSVYTRGSSPELIAGTYVDRNMTLAIDGQGEIFLQDRTCVGSGTVEPIDPTYNMYRMELVVNACAGSEVYAIGSTFSGLAYLGDSGPGFTGDLLEYSLSSGGDQRALIWTRRARR